MTRLLGRLACWMGAHRWEWDWSYPVDGTPPVTTLDICTRCGRVR